MFITVKSLTAIIDTEIGYINEAYDNKGNFSDEVFDNYIQKMKETLNGRVKKLSEISCNKNLINTYSRRVLSVFAER